MNKDEALLNAITSGKAVLFLGSGALATSQLSNGDFSPLGNSLAEIVFRNFYPDENYEWESLQQVSSNVKSTFGKEKLHDFLRITFEGIKPSKGIKRLTEFDWSRIYTTNIDRALESAYANTSKRAKDLVTVVGPTDTASSSPKTETTLYKLHGCVSRPDVDLVFSLDEYAEYKESHLKLFNQLSIDLVDRPIIFIGYSMVDSNFQSTLATINKYCDTTTRKNSYFFVGPNIKSSLAGYLESNGFVHLDFGVDEFAEHLCNLTAGKRTTLRDYYVENTLNLELFNKAKLDEKTAYSLSKDYYFPSIEIGKPLLKNTRFYEGSYPSWSDIKHKLDAIRDIQEDIIFSFEAWYSNPKFGIWTITGRAGDGKSTILKRFAAEVGSRVGDHVLFAKSRSELDPEQLEALQKSVDTPIILFIDNLTDRLWKVNQLIARFRVNKIKILIVGAARTSDWYSSINDFYAKPIEFSLDRLSDNEINGIIQRLEVHDSLHTLQDKTPEQRFEIFNEKSDRELIVAMCEATSGYSLEEIIANEYTGLKSELAKKSYLHICLIHQFRYRMPQSLFLRVLDLNLNTVKKDVFDLTKDVLFTDEADDTDYLLRSRHSVIAGIVSKYYFKDDVKKVDYLTAVFRDYVPSNPLEASLIKKLYHHTTINEMFDNVEIGANCYEQLAIHVVDNPYLLQQKALFLAYYTNDYTASKTTIQEAIRLNQNSNVLHHTHGMILMKEAIEEGDKDKSIYFLEEGKRILLQGARRNANNVYNFHTLISNLIRWYQKQGEDDNNLILEIQELVDEASQRHPNDAMILTEHGKLHELLHNSEDSKKYFKKAIKINPGNTAARYLLAKIYISEGETELAYQLCDEGAKIKPEEVQINRLRFELIHHSNQFEISEIVREYEDYLHANKKDSFMRLCYAAFLYANGDKKCDRIFRELRNSEILSFKDKLRVSPEINRIINCDLRETGTVIGSRPVGYILKNDRFNCNTHNFLSNNKMQGLKPRDKVTYKVAFNYLGPFADKPRLVR